MSDEQHSGYQHPTAQSHEIPVDDLRLTLMWPILIQAKKVSERKYQAPRLSPDQPGFLNAWSDHLCKDGTWRPMSRAFPASMQSYSEFCYFHPFVRNFLYVTRDDLRQMHKRKSELPVNRNLRILERTDIDQSIGKAANLDLWYDCQSDGSNWIPLRTTFSVDSCWLYLFDTQVAILEIQLSHLQTIESACSRADYKTAPVISADSAIDNPLKLRTVLKLRDIVRRVYSPYWSVSQYGDTIAHRDSHVPNRLGLKFSNSGQVRTQLDCFGNFEVSSRKHDLDSIKQGNYPKTNEPRTEADFELRDAIEAVESHRSWVSEHREPYASKVWRLLLHGIEPTSFTRKGERTHSPLQFEHIQDDRVPMLSFISVGSAGDGLVGKDRWIRRISPGDWIRLAEIDDDGDSDRFPYSPTFFDDVKDPVKAQAYDRFWHPTGMGDVESDRSKLTEGESYAQDGMHSTRWLISAYGLSAVGDRDSEFFNDAHAGALCHFNHHYFALFMIGLFHRASLLRFKHNLSEAADAMLQDEHVQSIVEWEFRQRVQRLSKELMRFRTLYWFSEVSNQIQGVQMFRILREQMQLDELFDDVTADIESADNLLSQWDEQRKERTSSTITSLGYAAAIFGPLLAVLNTKTEANPELAFGASLLALGICLIFVELPVQFRWVRRFYRAFKPGRFFSPGLIRRLIGIAISIGGLLWLSPIWMDQWTPIQKAIITFCNRLF